MDPNSFEQPVHALLRERRAALGLSLAQLAERVGCSRSYLFALEHGQKRASERLLIELESSLGMEPGTLVELDRWQTLPESYRVRLTTLERERTASRRAAHRLAVLCAGGLDDALRSGALRELIDTIAPEDGSPQPVALPSLVPLINSVQAGYPCEFTDLGYPARVADEYVRCPDVHDPDAFAARVVGDSMQPDYREGDVVVFSPSRDASPGSDCFARLEPDHETTFKRVYFDTDEDGSELIRLQPLNPAYPPRALPREQVAGLYPAVSVIRPVG